MKKKYTPPTLKYVSVKVEMGTPNSGGSSQKVTTLIISGIFDNNIASQNQATQYISSDWEW